MSVVTEGINQFLDWAMGIVTILIIYYIIKFFAAGKAEEAGSGKRREKLKEFLKGKSKGKAEKKIIEKEKKKRKEKKDLVSPIKNDIKDAIMCCDGIIIHLDAKKPKEAEKMVEKFDKHMHNARTNLKLLRGKFKGGPRQITSIQEGLEAIKKVFKEEVKNKLPKQVDSTWTMKVKPIKANVVRLRGSCGAIWNELRRFHK